MTCAAFPDLIPLTSRVRRLRERLDQEFARVPGGHKLVCLEEGECYARLAVEAYSSSVGKPEILRRAEFLRHFAEQVPVSIREDERIVGSQRFTAPPFQALFTRTQLSQCGIHRNHGHIIVDYGRVLFHGLDGLRTAVEALPTGVNRDAFALALEAFATFICRHGCNDLAGRPPTSFHGALQLTWFVQLFLSAEGLASAISFGRFDQFLWPHLRRDLEEGRCTPEQAYELICCFLMKCCEGAESQNLTVGGPADENPLSLMVLRAMRELKVWQPSISVRIGADTSAAFWHEALRLCDAGIGMPSFFNEPVVVAALRRLDIPSGLAEDWGIVGCYEAAPQGDSYPMTVGGGLALPELLRTYLGTQPEAGSFGEFLQGFKHHVTTTYREDILPGFARSREELARSGVSPFESLCVTGCMESGRAVEEGGARFNLFGVNILGIGTLIDSLLALRTLVFAEGRLTLAEMTRQLDENFPDRILLQRCRTLSGKFGSDTAESNGLARELSAFIAGEILASRLPEGVRPYPGFFWFGQDINRKVGATPDGRLANDRVSYGCGPGVLLERADVTAILNAAAQIDHAACACGNPLTLSFNRAELAGERGLMLLRQVIEAYFAEGGFHLHFNILDAEDLKKAKRTPERYQDLTVRISGFSARFTALSEPWQDAIIERTEKNL